MITRMKCLITLIQKNESIFCVTAGHDLTYTYGEDNKIDIEDTINDIIDKSIAEDIKDKEIDVTIEDTIEDKSDCFGEDIKDDTIIDKIGKSIGEDIKENTEDTVDGINS